MASQQASQQLEGIRHLDGTMYKVRSDLIQFADFDGNVGKGLKFFNPRCALIDGIPSGVGLSKHEMEELKEAIRTEGLHHPLLLRSLGQNLGERKLVILGGERRKRCIDQLKEENVPCFDPATGKWVPARELYEWIDCRIFINIDDKTAFKHAFSGNERATDIGEGATVALVKMFREAGYDDKEIMDITSKSITWLRDTDALIALDDKTFNSFAIGEVNRTVALQLAKVPDLNERLTRLAKAREMAAQRIAALQEKINADLEAAERAAELAEAQVVESELNGDRRGKQRAQQRAKRMRAKIDRKLEEQESMEGRSVRVSGKDLDKVNREMADDFHKRLTFAKHEKFWVPELQEIVKCGGKDAEGNQVCDPDDARLLLAVWFNGWEKGERHPATILKAHYNAKHRHTAAK